MDDHPFSRQACMPLPVADGTNSMFLRAATRQQLIKGRSGADPMKRAICTWRDSEQLKKLFLLAKRRHHHHLILFLILFLHALMVRR
jgi:hypothetical protein